MKCVRPALFELIERNPRVRLSRSAANAICLGCSPEEAMRLAETAETFRAIGELLVHENYVDIHRFASGYLAAPDRRP